MVYGRLFRAIVVNMTIYFYLAVISVAKCDFVLYRRKIFDTVKQEH